MKTKRWLIGGGGLLVVVVGGYALLHDGGKAQAMTKGGRSGEVAMNAPKKVQFDQPADPFARQPNAPQQPKVRYNPINKSYEREMVDAVPNPEAAAREELQYRISRLRLSASDAAAQCYKGDDSNQTIHIEYTVVVDKEQLRADNVRVLDNSITDSQVTGCIIQSVKDMSSFAERMPDMRKDEELVMSLHDLYTRNRSVDSQDQDSKTAVDPMPTRYDLPPVKVPTGSN
nr:hypothetical protein [Kofleriaceae bacterium]